MRRPDMNRYLNAIRHIESEEIPYAKDVIELSRARGGMACN